MRGLACRTRPHFSWLPRSLALRRNCFSDVPSSREFPRQPHRYGDTVRERQPRAARAPRGVPVTFWGTALSIGILGPGHWVWLTSSPGDCGDQNACRPPKEIPEFA